MRSGVLMTHSPTTRSPDLEARYVLADLDDLADPFVAGRHRIGDRDDVLAGEQLVVRMADADAARADQHLVVGRSVGDLDLRDDRLLGFVENQGFHALPPC